MIAYDAKSFYLEKGKMCTRDPRMRLEQGVDVSAHQGEIDWELVRADGISFAMLRAAFRGYSAGSLNVDSCFERNARQALRAGLQVGAYVFSQAVSIEEALAEAELLIDLVQRYPITGPLAFDWEVIGQGRGRADGLDTDAVCALADAFCRRVADAGYQPAVYFNADEVPLKYDLDRIGDWPFWVAQYREQPDISCGFALWQYTDRGCVSGIAGPVDRDVRLISEQ